MTNKASRREFIRAASALSLAGSATPWAINLAGIGAAAAQTVPSDYKALVCIFMYGGNDHSNTIIPVDAAGYQQYAQSRGNLALAQNTLLPLNAPTNASLSGRQVAMRAEMGQSFDATQMSLKALYDAGNLAVLSNVGTLRVPTTMAQYRARSVPLPPQLFSHDDQQTNWQASPTAREGTRVGWGGLIGDLFAASNQFQNFTCMSASGGTVFLSGRTTVQMQIGNNGAVQVNALNNQTLFGGRNVGNTVRAIMTSDRTQTLEKDYNAINKRAADSAQALNTALASVALTTTFPNSGLGSQLRSVARVIAARTALSSRRQVFHVSIGGFDQHSGLVNGHGPLWATISQAMGAFYAATVEMGIADKVTTFTASDFGRTLNSNGDGSDHGWGAHHIAVGGAVKGGDVYGAFPTVALGGPEDVGRGNLLPAQAVVQYAATLAAWFGVPASSLSTVIPGVESFSADLGFMNAS
ncbi:MAG TPA: DUF1501 domain-containing protein [Burkholderiaceae bacterium]|nr:DUF1501 domain-containing protein [Burkholderiaceae bacterium]